MALHLDSDSPPRREVSRPVIRPAQLAASYRRRLTLDHVVSVEEASQRDRFESLAWALRDAIVERWALTQKTHDAADPKRVYYLSMEFLIGRALMNSLGNLEAEPAVQDALRTDLFHDWQRMLESEPDPGLGNGGLGRLAACFIDSLATLQIPAMGYGLRYEYGIFRQEINHGFQVERPDSWLMRPDPWEVCRPEQEVRVPVACAFELEHGVWKAQPGRGSHLLGIPYDRPVVGFGGRTVNTLRLWRAAAPESLDLDEFGTGDFIGAVAQRIIGETVTRVLYPDDSTTAGQTLRFVQEYFLVGCTIADIVGRFRKGHDDWGLLPEKAAIQLNDTHPAIAVAELMRWLLDEGELDWDRAWDLTTRTLAYTNHTLLPEALERWPVRFFELVCPRLLEIIYEINRVFLEEVERQSPGDVERVRRLSLIDDDLSPHVRMAHLAILGTHSTNGVSRIHTELLQRRVVPDFARMFPERFNNKTNGVTPRRWLRQANPDLAQLLTEAIGPEWITDFDQVRRVQSLADDAAFQEEFRRAKRRAKERFVDWLQTETGQVVDPESLFDSQIKRIHEYKRQLLAALHLVVLYNRLRADPGMTFPTRTFFFAGKAAPAYRLAKLIIKFIGNLSETMAADPLVRDRLRVLFLPNFNVSLAERLVPASDLSEQISTAGYEASGTGNMKFMMNGALTIGTRDGATIEMAQEAGEENLFLFGLSAEQVIETRGWYSPQWHYDHEPETRQALDLIFSDHFSRNEPGLFAPLREALLEQGDYYMHLADLTAYAQAQQQVSAEYADPEGWTRKGILNLAASGRFSSDRTIAEYAQDIWRVAPCPVE
ncbi:MAG: glycogen/starch/alpha-glucan phosphorylase [Planctomycetales bacterium]